MTLLERAFEGIAVPHVVSGRRGGVSRGSYRSLDLGLHVGDDPVRVLRNRRRLAGSLGLDPRSFVVAEQVHGSRVAVVGAADRGRGALSAEDALRGVDALATSEPGLPLMSLAADCLSVLLHDPEAPAVAVAHAGWRGLAGGVLEATVRCLCDVLGARRSRLVAGLGPAIGPCCYEVGDEVVEALGEDHARPLGSGRSVDLGAAALAALGRSGIAADRVHRMDECTSCRREDLFSHRASGGRPTGRHALVAWLS